LLLGCLANAQVHGAEDLLLAGRLLAVAAEIRANRTDGDHGAPVADPSRYRMLRAVRQSRFLPDLVGELPYLRHAKPNRRETS
jgi:hypothetical protein